MQRSPPKIGVVICTSRKPRANPQIASFVVDTIKATSLKRPRGVAPSLKFIDLQEWNLPFFDESDVPSQITDPSKYDHAHTRAWSQEVRSYDAFIFVTPQYNWGYPAVLKNAIDYLYNEWKGKPAMIVSYGGHGGGKCNAQLRQVLGGINMIPTKKSVELAFPGKEFMVKAARGKQLDLNGASSSGVWSGAERKNISEAFAELLDLLSTNVSPERCKTPSQTNPPSRK
jgi:NAD(P)H-dependent FMN reductase